MHQKGFTMIELVLIITLLGVLAIAALPKFINLSQEANKVSRDGILSAVRAGIALHQANEGSYPETLDSVKSTTNCGPESLCFADITFIGVDDPSWHKVDANTYTHNDGSTTAIFKYDSAEGTFTSKK
jgi:MSHA pilin protein MshB